MALYDPISRTAPKAGYATDAKAEYRRAVWKCLAKAIPALGEGKVVILPSSEGIEIDVALGHGVPAENILCVDRSPAVIATSKWRKTHPSLSFHGVEIARLPQKLEAKSVKVANLDLCGMVSGETIRQIRDFVQGAQMADGFTVAITVAKGREDSGLVALLDSLDGNTDINCKRMRAVAHMAGLIDGNDRSVKVVGQGSYVSGRHPMTWAVFRAEKPQSRAPVIEFIRALRYAERSVKQNYTNTSSWFDDLVRAEKRVGFFGPDWGMGRDNDILPSELEFWLSEHERVTPYDQRLKKAEVVKFSELREKAWREAVGNG